MNSIWLCAAMKFHAQNNVLQYRSTVAQMAERATQDQKVLGSVPAWIKWDFALKYLAYLFCKFVTEDRDMWSIVIYVVVSSLGMGINITPLPFHSIPHQNNTAFH